MIITIANNIKILNPTPPILRWSKENLRVSNPDYVKKARMGFWVGNTPKTIDLYESHGNTLVLPFGVLKQVYRICKDALMCDGFTPAGVVNYGEEIPLYDYQQLAVEACVEGLYGILQSRAGSGKTQMGIALIQQWKRRALWLTHTADLLNQSKERAERYFDKSLIGTITEGKVNIGSGVTFATIQTMCKLDLALYKDMWDVIIVDECHRVAGTPTAVTQFSKVLNSLSARHKYGLSATVHRADGMIKATYSLLGDVIYTVPDEAVADKVMQVGVKTWYTGAKLTRDCLNTDGTLNYAKLISYLTTDHNRTKQIADCIIAEKERPCLILSDRLEHLQAIASCLPMGMIDKAVMVTGKMTSKKGKAERAQAIEDMRTGDKKYLFATYKLAKEGLDIPCLERLFLASPQKDYAVITQAVGRIARTSEGKAAPIVMDFVDDFGYAVKMYRHRVSHYKKNGCYFV